MPIQSGREIVRFVRNLMPPSSILYGLQRDEVDYVMESFPIVKRKDLSNLATIGQKTRSLEVFDDLAKSVESGISYQSWLNKAPN